MLSDERLAEIRAAVEGSRAVHNRPWIAELLAAYDEQRAEVERLRAQVAAVEALTVVEWESEETKADWLLLRVGQVRAALDTDGGSDD